MQPNRATSQTPFFLVYVSEAVLPTDLMFNAPWVEIYKEEDTEKVQIEDIDSMEEGWVPTCIQAMRYAQGLQRYHNKIIQARGLCIGELVLWRI